jgi:hypothetical protein
MLAQNSWQNCHIPHSTVHGTRILGPHLPPFPSIPPITHSPITHTIYSLTHPIYSHLVYSSLYYTLTTPLLIIYIIYLFILFFFIVYILKGFNIYFNNSTQGKYIGKSRVYRVRDSYRVR